MFVRIIDYLEPRKKRPYKPLVPRSTIATRAGLVTEEEAASGNPLPQSRRPPPGWMGTEHYGFTRHDVTRQFPLLQAAQGGQQDLRLLQPADAEKNGLKGISRLPFSMKVLLENLLRNEDGRSVTKEDIQAVAQWLKTKTSEREIAFRPARVLMQDFTGVPAVVDLAAMRDAMKSWAATRRRSIRWSRSTSSATTRWRSLLRQPTRAQEERRGGIPAERERYEFLKVVAEVVRQLPRGAARHRHLPPGQSRISVADGLDQEGQGQARRQAVRPWRSPIPTRWSAPTRTPPWSTACRCWAGASAASRRKPPCSASPIRCCCPR
jgi:hypothetical protein